MERAFGLEIPQSVEEACDPQRVALLVYDMQVGILRHVERSTDIIANVVCVVTAPRQAGVRVFCLRHMSLPKQHWISRYATAGSIPSSWSGWRPQLASSRPCAIAATSATCRSSSPMHVGPGIERRGLGPPRVCGLWAMLASRRSKRFVACCAARRTAQPN
jgi:hypothetical protein